MFKLQQHLDRRDALIEGIGSVSKRAELGERAIGPRREKIFGARGDAAAGFAETGHHA